MSSTSALSLRQCRNFSTNNHQLASDTIISDIRTALSLWFKEWTRLHESMTSKDEWEALGFYKNGDQYAYATLLLLSSKARPYLKRLLRPNTDRLSCLQELNKEIALEN